MGADDMWDHLCYTAEIVIGSQLEAVEICHPELQAVAGEHCPGQQVIGVGMGRETSQDGQAVDLCY